MKIRSRTNIHMFWKISASENVDAIHRYVAHPSLFELRRALLRFHITFYFQSTRPIFILGLHFVAPWRAKKWWIIARASLGPPSLKLRRMWASQGHSSHSTARFSWTQNWSNGLPFEARRAKNGAGEENRTPGSTLAMSCITTILRPHFLDYISCRHIYKRIWK